MRFLNDIRKEMSDWLRSGLLSGTVSGALRAVADVVYYCAFAFCLSWSFLRSTTMFSRIMTHEMKASMDGLYESVALVVILCGIAALLAQNSVRLAVFSGVLLAAGYVNWKDGCEKTFLYLMCALVVGGTGRSFRMILRIYLLVGTILMLCAFFASQAGIIEDLVYSGNRHSFGIVYCTDCAAHVLFLMLAWLMLRIESMRPLDFAPLVPCLVFMYFTHAKTNILCALLMIVGVVLYYLSVRRHKKGLWRIPCAVFCFSFPLCALMSISSAFLINTENARLRAALDSIDRSLVKRLEMSRRAFAENPVSLFGTKVTENGFGGKVGGFKGWDSYFFIDNSYIRLFLFGGIVLFVLVLAVLTYAQLRCYAGGRYGCVFLLWIVAVTCLMEHHLIEYYYNVFPLMAFSGSSFFRMRRTGKRAAGPVQKEKSSDRIT